MKKVLLSLLLVTALTVAAWSQHKITGIVRGYNNEPIEAASVLVRSTNTFATTGEDGRYTLEVLQAPPFILRIQAVGFKYRDITVNEITGTPIETTLIEDNLLEEIVVTSRRREETAQSVPIPISVISGNLIDEAGAFNVNRVKEYVPSVQLYSSNPRNTGINIRGLGSPFGLTNDGLDPGVGFYVDGVYFARPAFATLDFIDVEQIEVLRGPQGTLFGKNTTAGAFNIKTRQASFTPGASFELSYGNYGYIQAKTSITGPLIKNKLAARVSFSGTQRDGTIHNIAKDEWVNDINNLGGRAQLLYTPNENITITLSGDASSQKPNGYAQSIAGIAVTKRAAYRQFSSIIKDLNYTLPTDNSYDRVIDQDTPWRSLNELGGLSLNADFKIGPGTLTSTTAWRYWNWGPSNDRDFTGLQALRLSQNPSEHRNWSQEVRYAGSLNDKITGVIGVFALGQQIDTHGTEESGNAQWRFSQSTTSSLWKTPGLFDGYGIHTESSIKSLSAAVFANVDWAITKKFHVLPGLRFNYDKKDVTYDRNTYGGLQTTDPALLALKALVYTDQAFATSANENNFTYQLTANYKANDNYSAYATFSTAFKPVGVNVAGLPVVDGQPALDLAQIKPEYVTHYEAGLKSTPVTGLTANITFYYTHIDDYQTNVQSPQLGVNRGYIANAEEVSVKGSELDLNWRVSEHFKAFTSLAYTDGKYDKFTNAPLPLEEVGSTQDGQQLAFKDISGGVLPGISKWAGSIGAELNSKTLQIFNLPGYLFLAGDTYFRSGFSSSPSPSSELNISGYYLVNARAGFRALDGLSLSIWSRNLLNNNYNEQFLVAGGSTGQYAAVVGDPRTYGVTIKYEF
jgi:iron complex outermembrane receptor protein